MTPPLRKLILLAVIVLLAFIPPAFSATLLTDTELDELGAGGAVSLVHQVGEHGVAPLSDEDLDHISGMWAPEFIWPFQYVPDKFIGHTLASHPSKGNAQGEQAMGPGVQRSRLNIGHSFPTQYYNSGVPLLGGRQAG